MSLGIRGFNPIWAEFDLAGNIFDDRYYMFVLTNTIPYIPANVYHDPNLNVVWNNPIQFLANGTLPVDIYFESQMVYRLEFRMGPTQSDPLIYEVDNYIAGIGGSTPIDAGAATTDNQITNPQFSLVNFSSPYTLSATNPSPIEVAPGWFLELAGTGTLTLNRVALNNSNANPSNAPYALEITLNGWNNGQVFLRQRFQQNGMLWANKFVSSTLTARVQGAPQGVSATLYDSMGAPLAQVLSVPAIDGNWNEFTGGALLGNTTNTNTPPSAYIDYKLALPSNIDIFVTSIQLIVQDANNESEPSFEQDSIDRQIDHTFHYYKNSILYDAKESLLTGWDFGLNPWQFRTTAQTNLAVNGYTADQTIGVQQLFVAGGVGNNISVGQSSIGTNNGFTVQAVTATNQFAIMQYIDPTTIRSSWGKVLSSLVRLNATKQSTSNLRVKMRLIYRASLPPTLSQTEPVASWAASGEPVFAVGWTAVAPKNDPVYNLINGFNEIAFEGFQLPASIAANMTLGIIFYTLDNMIATGTADSIVFDQISLCQSDNAAAATKLTYDETLARCQYYFEKSYDPPILQGTASSDGALINQLSGQMYYNVYQPSGTINNQFTALHNTNFGIRFNRIKRTSAPLVSLYSIGGAINNVLAQGFDNGSLVLNTTLATSLWTQSNLGNKGVTYIVVSPGAKLYDNQQSNANPAAIIGSFVNGYINYHYAVDARLGLIA